MKVAIAQLNFQIGDFNYNSVKIVQSIQQAKKRKADLVIFPELSVCGYPPQDLLDRKDFIEHCVRTVKKIALHCDSTAAIIGCPTINKENKGKNLRNSAFFLYQKKICDVFHKTLLPDYDVFDEYRYFEPNRDFRLLRFKNKKIAVTICEDLWFDQPLENTFGKRKLYILSPMDQLIKEHPDFIVNISASPFSYRREEVKRNVFQNIAKKYKLPVLMVNQVGGQTEQIFEGASLCVNSKGNLAGMLNYFSEDFRVYDTDDLTKDSFSGKSKNAVSTIERIHDALVLGIKDFFEKQKLKKAVLGLSGGIDSAVTLALATRALGNRNVHAVLMPSAYSSKESVTDSIQLADTLKTSYDIISIDQIMKVYDTVLTFKFANQKPDVTEENIQARIRANILMALSNKFCFIVLNTSNKSEAATGYGTLYGDMTGGLSVLGDLYKTQVYELAHFINKNNEIIPLSIIRKTPSAELKPGQKDSDTLPDYDILDKLLFQYIECSKSAKDIVNAGFSKKMTGQIIGKIRASEYKRFQSPPILRVSSKSFGAGRKIPLVANFFKV